MYWLERPGDPVGEPWRYRVVDDAERGGVDGVHGLALADIDRDGRPDVVCSSGQPKGAFPDSLAWFRIPLWARYILANRDAPGLSHYIGVGDVDGDGRPDVASAAKDSPGGNWFAWWQQGKDPAQPWRKHAIAADQTGATNILMADVNGDRRTDFVASRGHGRGVLWFEAPQWTQRERLTDMNGDGRLDLLVAGFESANVVWYENPSLRDRKKEQP